MIAGAAMTYDGGSVEVLNRLIERRIREAGESAKDAVAAVMIDALVALRKLTRKAKAGGKTKAGIVHLTQYAVSGTWDGERRYAVRDRSGVRVDLPGRVKYLAKGQHAKHLKVFEITPEHQKSKRYFIACPSEKVAAAFEQRRARHDKVSAGGLARNALSLAMRSVSTRNVTEAAGEYAQKRTPEFVQVRKGGTGDTFSIEAKDVLEHAVAALQGGRSAIDLALKRAANRVTAILSRKLMAKGDLREKLESPFPEVKR
ncbi:MAG: hypothetical protein IKO64_05595 [Kiritimatiellae bacterium]|nr:hypothetical protein [Kiritimatiellia bacterium]